MTLVFHFKKLEKAEVTKLKASKGKRVTEVRAKLTKPSIEKQCEKTNEAKSCFFENILRAPGMPTLRQAEVMWQLPGSTAPCSFQLKWITRSRGKQGNLRNNFHPERDKIGPFTHAGTTCYLEARWIVVARKDGASMWRALCLLQQGFRNSCHGIP